MRLVPLREQKSAFNDYAQMWKGFLLEQGEVCDESNSLQEKLLDSNRELFLIEHAGAIIGFAEVQLEEECFPDEDMPEICMKIDAFYLQPESRHKNLGHQAFKLTRQWGRDKEAALVEIEVSKALAESNKFLQKEGLELVGSGPRNVWRGFI